MWISRSWVKRWGHEVIKGGLNHEKVWDSHSWTFIGTVMIFCMEIDSYDIYLSFEYQGHRSSLEFTVSKKSNLESSVFRRTITVMNHYILHGLTQYTRAQPIHFDVALYKHRQTSSPMPYWQLLGSATCKLEVISWFTSQLKFRHLTDVNLSLPKTLEDGFVNTQVIFHAYLILG